MARWEHTLRLKELWASRDDDDDKQAVEVAPTVADRVAALGRKLDTKEPFLSADLEEIASDFRDVPDREQPSVAFNEILTNLYDLADAHRIWIA